MDMSRKIAMAGLGALAVTREKAEKLIDELAEKGEMNSEEIKRFFNELVDKGRHTRNKFADSMGYTHENDYHSLELRISRIEHMLGIEAEHPDRSYDEAHFHQPQRGSRRYGRQRYGRQQQQRYYTHQ
ncbi:phasin family protein [Desulfofalx alkaliphila]|uniref:phasin family protein n=1 Tax=Desulfofalx alkaliphila TaxID=105483 RepID=UPI00055454AC|nr:hypothetical protein [Desulfofalx alkaliphila]